MGWRLPIRSESALIGLDIGASFAKGVLVNEKLKIIDKYFLPVIDPRVATQKILGRLFKRFGGSFMGTVAASGGGSRFLSNEILGLPIKRVDEIRAIGVGGLLLSGKSEGLVVSAGTGTAVVAAYDHGKVVRHLCGTAIGGGTIIGLSRRMLGIADFKVLEDMASRGDASRVDLTVGDIIGGPIGIVPANATASNFGKLTCESSAEDVAAGIFNMVSQTIGVVAAMAARACGLEDNVIVTGMLAKSNLFSRIMYETGELFGAKVIIPEDCEFAGALGAAAILWELDHK